METHDFPIEVNMPQDRVKATEAAIEMLRMLRRRHGPIMFHFSHGCCDGSAPMCFPEGDYILGDSDVKLGEIDGVGFYTASDHPVCRSDFITVLDVVAGRGNSFSLEAPEGVRFLARSEYIGGAAA